MKYEEIKNVLGNATMCVVGTVTGTWETAKSKGVNVAFKWKADDKYFQSVSVSCDSIAEIREGDYVEVTGHISGFFKNNETKYYFIEGKVRRL